jgi:hypothetical protein
MAEGTLLRIGAGNRVLVTISLFVTAYFGLANSRESIRRPSITGSPDHPISRFRLKRFLSFRHFFIWGRPSQLRITSRARFRLGRSHEEYRAIGPSDPATNGVNMRLKSQWWGFLILSIFGKRSGVGSADSGWD